MFNDAKEIELVAGVLSKLHLAQAIGDEELDKSIIFLGGIIYFLSCLGERYFLTKQQLRNDLEVLEKIKAFRTKKISTIEYKNSFS